MFAIPHASRIRAVDPQFNFNDVTATDALRGCENLYAIATINNTSTVLAASASTTLVFDWDASLGTFSSTSKAGYLQTGFLAATGPGSISIDGISGHDGVFMQIRKKSSTVGGTTSGRIASLSSRPNVSYCGGFDDTIVNTPYSYRVFATSTDDITVTNAWFSDSGVHVTLKNNDSVGSQTINIRGFGYGFC